MMAPHTAVTILVIDDTPAFVRGLSALLMRDGFLVDTAANGQLALARLHERHYDVILCDCHMPALDGLTFYAILARQYPHLRQRVLFLTGETLSATTVAFLEQCGQPWLLKPCTMAVIRSAIAHLLQRIAPDPLPGNGPAGEE